MTIYILNFINEETLASFALQGDTLVHTKTNIQVAHYFACYYDYYCEQLAITPAHLNACKNLTLTLVQTIEGKRNKLTMPAAQGIECIIQLINDVDAFLQMYHGNSIVFFMLIEDFLCHQSAMPYHNHCFDMLLQNYVNYILAFHFEEMNKLIDYFTEQPLYCKLIINKLFGYTIFMQKIIKQANIALSEYPRLTQFFEQETSDIYQA